MFYRKSGKFLQINAEGIITKFLDERYPEDPKLHSLVGLLAFRSIKVSRHYCACSHVLRPFKEILPRTRPRPPPHDSSGLLIGREEF